MNTLDALGVILDPTRLSDLCGHPLYASHLRIKPDVAIIAAVNDSDTGHPCGWVRLLWPVSHSKARKAQFIAQQFGARTHTSPLEGDLIADYGRIEADPVLAPHVKAWADTHALTNGDTTRILRYNPLRRLVIRDQQSVVRLYATPQADADDILDMIRQAVPTPQRLPIPLAPDHASAAHMARMSFCGDGDIAQLTASHTDTQFVAHAHRQAGELFAHLHAATPTLSVPLVERLLDRAPNAHTQGQAHAGILDALDPKAAERLRAATRRLPSIASPQRVLSHGDASADQILTTADLSRTWMTDFDRACLAAPALDLGSYLALCDEASGAAFLDGYSNAGGQLPSQSDLRAARAASMVARLAEPLKKADRDWHTHTLHRLEQIEELLS